MDRPLAQRIDWHDEPDVDPDMLPQVKEYRMPGGTPALGQTYQMPDRVFERRGAEEGYDTPPWPRIPLPSQRSGGMPSVNQEIKPPASLPGNIDPDTGLDKDFLEPSLMPSGPSGFEVGSHFTHKLYTFKNISFRRRIRIINRTIVT